MISTSSLPRHKTNCKEMKVCFRILSKQTDSNTVMWLNETCICFQPGTCLACAKHSVVFLSWMVELRILQCASLNTGTDWAIQSFPWANRITRAATSLGIVCFRHNWLNQSLEFIDAVELSKRNFSVVGPRSTVLLEQHREGKAEPKVMPSICGEGWGVAQLQSV